MRRVALRDDRPRGLEALGSRGYPHEDCFLCPADCGQCPGCPDGFCGGVETCASCQPDCGVCSVCGNNVCEGPFETCTNCNADCGDCDPLNCLEVVTCAFGCVDLSVDPPSFQIGCLGQCIAQGCADVQFFVQQVLDCAIIPGAGGTQRLPRIVGEARAKEMILLGRPLSAAEALSWGLVNRVTAEGADVVADVIGWIEPIASGAPIAQAAALAAIDDSFDVSLGHGLELERVHYDETLRSEDRTEALKAFAEKRKPAFKGR